MTVIGNIQSYTIKSPTVLWFKRWGPLMNMDRMEKISKLAGIIIVICKLKYSQI
jgi:hypothetical protein